MHHPETPGGDGARGALRCRCGTTICFAIMDTGMTDSTSTRPLAVVLAELGWKPEVLARQLNSFAALQGRVERMHAKTPYNWLRGDRPLSRGPR